MGGRLFNLCSVSLQEARDLPFVGERIANKIDEIIFSGGLRRLEHVDKKKEAVISTFLNIHGVGEVIAHQFYAKVRAPSLISFAGSSDTEPYSYSQGYRTLDELRDSGVLNRQQRIGLRHFEDFNERMTREEVAEIEERVRVWSTSSHCQYCTHRTLLNTLYCPMEMAE